MTSSSTPPQAAPEIDIGRDDQDHIERELDAFEAIVRATNETDPRWANSTLNPPRWH